MRKFLAVTTLCCALVGGAVMAPTVYNAVQLRLTMWRMPGLIMTEGQSAAFAQMIIDFIVQWLVEGAFGGSTQTKKGEYEKWIASAKELVQAEMNQQAAQTVTENFARAQGDFTPNNVERACRIARESQETQSAATSAQIESKSIAIFEAREHASGKPESQVAKEAIETHNQKYCSADGVARQRCTTVSNTPDADIQAATLMSGDGSETFTKEQYEAARMFMRNVTDPVPPEDLPKALEKLPGGQRYLMEQKAYGAVMSMSQQTFARILAARSPTTP